MHRVAIRLQAKRKKLLEPWVDGITMECLGMEKSS